MDLIYQEPTKNSCIFININERMNKHHNKYITPLVNVG